jgi:hypothetical protein
MANQTTPVIQVKDSNVGIGTTSPTNKLHINSIEDNAYALRVQGNTENASGVWTGIGIAGEGSNTKTAIIFQDIGVSYSRGRLIFALNNVDDQSNATPANAVMTLQPGGNVLIGTTTDAGYKLSVAGNAVLGYAQNRPVYYDSGGGNFQIQGSAGGWAMGYFFQGNGGTYRGGWGALGGNNDLTYLWAGDAYDTPTMVVYGAQGNVGIGTTEPSNKLTVTRSAATQGSESTYGLRVVQGKPLTLGGDADYAYIQSWSSGPLAINSQGNNVLFPNTSTQLGIGTYSPSNGMNGSGVTIGNLSGTYGFIELSASDANSYGSWIDFSQSTGADYKGRIRYWTATNSFKFYTNENSTELVTFTPNNVLIGTTTDAGYKLDVNGTGRFQANLIAGSRQYINTTLVAYKIPYNGLSIVGTTVSDSQASDGAAAVRYSSEGNNTFFYGPYTTLEPGSYVAKFRLKVASNASGSFIGYIDVSGTNVSGTDVSLRPNMFPTGGDYYYIDVPFTCNGSASGIEFRWIDWRSGITDTYLDHILITSQAREDKVYVPDGGNYTIYEAQLPRLFIANGTGNVGIGTTSPSTQLHISGTTTNITLTDTTYNRTSNIGYIDSANLYFANDAGSNTYIGRYNAVFLCYNGGNVVVGSSTDAGYKLDVHGEILGRDDIRILNTYALILNGSDANWRIGRNTITDSGWLTGNTTQIVVSNASSGQGFQVVNSGGTALFEVEGISGYTRISISLGVGVNPSGTTGRIDASNDIVAFSTSDRRLKENITPIANALDKVKALTGVEFDWKEETKHVHGYEGHDSGVIAQEVKEIMPTAIRENESGYLSVRYEKLIGLLIEAVKEQQAEIDALKKLIK